MNNISFDNPYLLFIGLGLLIIIISSFFIGIRKGSRRIRNVISLILHIVMIVLITLSIARMQLETVMTETNVYALADVSYSGNNNYDLIDQKINELSKNLPKNSKLGVVAFAKNQEILVNPGEKLKSVKNSNVDTSETNIVEALAYTANLFNDNVIKRIVIISDGKDTNNASFDSIREELISKNIYVDAIYINNNITIDEAEIQIDDVEFEETTYLKKESNINVYIESNKESKAVLEIFKGDLLYKTKIEALDEGINIINASLDTEEAGIFDYKVKVSEYEEEGIQYDTSKYNNEFFFTQEVVSRVKVLFISKSNSDKEVYDSLYDEEEYYTEYYVNDLNVPYRIEDLCLYDEIVISNVNVSELNNCDAFVNNLEKAVSEFGKSLITLGNTYIQNDEENETLKEFASILPVKFDNNENNKKLYTIIVDISKSMFQVSHLQMAKETACTIIDTLDENYDLNVIAFYGDVETLCVGLEMLPSNKEEIKNAIMALEAKQATSLAAGLKRALSLTQNLVYSRKDVMLLSDGLAYSLDEDTSVDTATKLANSNSHVNVVFTANRYDSEENSLLKSIASAGNGVYYQVYDLETARNLVLTEIADEITENHKIGSFKPTIIKTKDDLVSGINGGLGNVNDFYTCILKPTASTIINVNDNDKSYPLYSTWIYGNGSVTSLAANISGDSLDSWKTNESSGKEVLSRILNVNTPKMKAYYPYLIEIENNGATANVFVSAPVATSNMEFELNVTLPSGDVKNYLLSFDSMNYFTIINTSQCGKYLIELKCKDGNTSYTASKVYSISYGSEYDEFQAYDPIYLYTIISDDGKVAIDDTLVITNEGIELQMYNFDFMPIFLIVSIVLFIIDVIIRKLKWKDIVSLFKNKNKEVRLK